MGNAWTEGDVYSWAWGDGVTTYTPEPTARHTYAAEGDFAIRVVALDPETGEPDGSVRPGRAAFVALQPGVRFAIPASVRFTRGAPVTYATELVNGGPDSYAQCYGEVQLSADQPLSVGDVTLEQHDVMGDGTGAWTALEFAPDGDELVASYGRFPVDKGLHGHSDNRVTVSADLASVHGVSVLYDDDNTELARAAYDLVRG